MVFEKMAKAAPLRSLQMTVAKAHGSHRAASRMVAVLKRNRGMLRTLGGGDVYAWKDVLPIVTEFERARLQLSEGGPQLEYPREDGATKTRSSGRRATFPSRGDSQLRVS